ncbi:hypothetical protein [Rhodanobacter lindaniclasticus]
MQLRAVAEFGAQVVPRQRATQFQHVQRRLRTCVQVQAAAADQAGLVAASCRMT